MKTHKKPVNATPSKLLTQFAEEIAVNSGGIVIDVACGYGRNAAYLASFGVPVICIDFNNDALEYIQSSANLSGEHSKGYGLLTVLKLDLINDPWPFQNESVGAIINIHFFHSSLIECFVKSIKIGGYLFIETIDGHGGNYLQLPKHGFIKSKVNNLFDIKYFKEKKVGPLQSDASTVKILAIKQKSFNIDTVAQ